MFRIVAVAVGSSYRITDEDGNSLHSDGSVYRTAEYWPTEADAQAVLDKFYPKPEHVWKHGDVFENCCGKQIYLKREGGEITVNLGHEDSNGTPAVQLPGAKFLFNIKEKI